LENDALFSIQIEGGKRNNSGLQIDITGTEGDLKVWNTKSFANKNDNILEGARGDKGSLEHLPVPPGYVKIPFSHLDVSVQDLAHLYAAHALDRLTGAQEAPNFADAVRMRFHDGRPSISIERRLCQRLFKPVPSRSCRKNQTEFSYD
jgi:hypothetical protein